MQTDVVVLDGARTPFGTFGGGLKSVTATDLGVVAAREAIRRSGVRPEEINHVVMGNVIQTSSDAIYLARHVGLKAGLPQEVPAVTVNRLCGSGLQAVASAAGMLITGEADVVLAGGTENMSQAPHVIRGARWGLGLGQGELEDYLWTALVDSFCGAGMAITAENLAERYGITRREQDEYAHRSQMATRAAQEAGRLAEEIVPVEMKDHRGRVTVVEKDEHPRPHTTLEDLARLEPRFKKGGVVTPGASSGINDGAAALVLTTEEKARERGLKPLGRLLSWASVGVDPSIMGIGPAPAIRAALRRAGLRLEDLDLVEVNEAFAVQYLSVERELGLDRERTNVNGGAVALGHPVGASGARLALTLLYELRRRGKRYGAASLCIGGGQGIAAIFEAVAA